MCNATNWITAWLPAIGWPFILVGWLILMRTCQRHFDRTNGRLRELELKTAWIQVGKEGRILTRIEVLPPEHPEVPQQH